MQPKSNSQWESNSSARPPTLSAWVRGAVTLKLMVMVMVSADGVTVRALSRISTNIGGVSDMSNL